MYIHIYIYIHMYIYNTLIILFCKLFFLLLYKPISAATTEPKAVRVRRRSHGYVLLHRRNRGSSADDVTGREESDRISLSLSIYIYILIHIYIYDYHRYMWIYLSMYLSISIYVMYMCRIVHILQNRVSCGCTLPAIYCNVIGYVYIYIYT